MDTPRRPFLILNAADMVTGEHFEFTQDQFDFLGSDLTPHPVGHAVAASSAFPFLLTPLTLVNHAPLRDFGPPLEYVNALKDFYANPARWQSADHQRTYLDGSRPYVHLLIVFSRPGPRHDQRVYSVAWACSNMPSESHRCAEGKRQHRAPDRRSLTIGVLIDSHSD